MLSSKTRSSSFGARKTALKNALKNALKKSWKNAWKNGLQNIGRCWKIIDKRLEKDWPKRRCKSRLALYHSLLNRNIRALLRLQRSILGFGSKRSKRVSRKDQESNFGALNGLGSLEFRMSNYSSNSSSTRRGHLGIQRNVSNRCLFLHLTPFPCKYVFSPSGIGTRLLGT